MKCSTFALLLAAMLLLTPSGVRASGGLSEFPPKVLPVLVRVDAQGRVTDVSPAFRLAPAMERLLRANLDEIVGRPAVSPDGHPIASQFVINLALVTSPRADGKFDVHFTYVSNVPVPAGSWYWVHTDGRQLALASQGSERHRQRFNQQGDAPLYRTGPFNVPFGGGNAAPAGPTTVPPPPGQPASTTGGTGRSGGTR